MENILISACLLGVRCRYDANSVPRVDVARLSEKYNLIPICPEIYGGLETPRTPSERVGDRVLMKDGRDVTENFIRGAEEAYRLAILFSCRKAILKERSPSCGNGEIYDGSFSGKTTFRDGVTAEYLKARGIEVFGESELEKFI